MRARLLLLLLLFLSSLSLLFLIFCARCVSLWSARDDFPQEASSSEIEAGLREVE